LVNDLTDVTVEELKSIESDNSFAVEILKEIRKVAPIAKTNDFVLAIDTSIAGNFDNDTFSKQATINVSASEKTKIIEGSFSFNINLFVHEETIEGSYSVSYSSNFNKHFSVGGGHADVNLVISGLELSFS
jgi:hypothetical protein